LSEIGGEKYRVVGANQSRQGKQETNNKRAD
jgi:hypothetical protein